MVWAIKLENSGYLNFDTQTSYHQDLSVYRFEADFVIPSGTTTPIYFVARNTSFSGYISIQSNGELRVRYNGTNLSWPSFGYPDDDQLHTIVVVRNGASHEAFLDGSSKGTVSNSITSPFLLTGIGNAGTLTSNFYLSRMRLWNNATGTGTPIHDHDANSSDRSNTGQQPILTDTAGGNNATGVGLPTDGSAWIDLGGGANNSEIDITISSPTFSAQATNTQPFISTVDFDVAPPVFSAQAQNTVPDLDSTISFDIPPPQFSASADNTIPGGGASVDFTIQSPIFSAQASNAAPEFESSVNFDVQKPIFLAQASNVTPGNNSIIDIDIPAPIFSAEATVTIPDRSASADIVISTPIFSVFAGKDTDIFYYSPGARVALRNQSRLSSLPNSSRTVKIKPLSRIARL